MPSPHYFTERNGLTMAINTKNKLTNWSDSAVDAAVSAAISSSSCTSSIPRLNFTRNLDDAAAGGGSYSTPVNHQKEMFRKCSGAAHNISMSVSKDNQTNDNHREVSSQSGRSFIKSRPMLVSASTPPRNVPNSPIVRRGSRGNVTSNTLGLNHGGATSKSSSSPATVKNDANVPKHNLFSYSSKHGDLKNGSTHDNKNTKDFDVNYNESDDASTSDEATTSSSSVGSGNPKSYRKVYLGVVGNAKKHSANNGQDSYQQKPCDVDMDTSPATAAAALEDHQQKNDNHHVGKTNSSNKRPTPVDKPRDTDVISGRGNGANRRPGNMRFREIVTKYKDMYLYAKAADKKVIARNVVREVEAMNPPARFLHQDEKTGMWTILDRRKTLRKVAQALREPSLRKSHGSSGNEVSSPQLGQQSPNIISEFSAEPRNGSQMEEETPVEAKCTPRSISLSTTGTTVNGTRHKRLLNRASIDESGINSDVNKKHRPESVSAIDPSEEGTSIFTRHNSSSLPVRHAVLTDLPQVPVNFKNSSYNVIDPAAQSLAGLTYGVTTIKDSHPFEGGTNIMHSVNTHGPFAEHLGDGAYLDQAKHRVPSQFLGRRDISMPYFLNYRNMSIVSSSPSSLMTLPTQKKHTGTVDNDHADTLRNISIVASRCSDLTALYLIVRTGSDSFTRNSFLTSSQNIKPTQYDVLINACDIPNHPGNLNLAESVQLSYNDYMNAELSGNLKSNIINYVISSITKESKPTSSGCQRDKRQGRFLLRYNPQVKTTSSPSEAWMVLSKKKVAAVVESLLQQACSFILHPDTNDVLFDRQDVSMLSPGNMYFKSIIDKCKSVYMKSTPENKLNCAVEIVGIVTSRPGRFLGNIEEMGMWTPLSFDSAIEKTQKYLSGDIF